MNDRNCLARAALDFFLLFLRPDRTHAIDEDFKCKIIESIPEYFYGMSEADQQALKKAAIDRLAWIRKGPDEYGYNPGLLVSNDEIGFLEALADGSIFEKWCKEV
jgi:hypothetical protein